MTDTLTSLLDKIPLENKGQPDFTAVLTAILNPLVNAQVVTASMIGLFDLDTAVGNQLDQVGEWVGFTRILDVPITNVYFTLDSNTLGLDFGSLQGPFDPSDALVSLPDASYRTYLKAQIIANHWDGTIPGAYAAWDALFASEGLNIFIQVAAKMHIIYGLIGGQPDAITLALFTGGYLSLKPAGVMIDSYQVNTLPYFALDSDTPPLGGLDHGAFGIIVG